MPITHRPGARLVLGYAARAAQPPPTYASSATLALQAVVSARGKDWKKVAPTFVVAPAAGSGRVVVGLAMARVPQIFESARTLEPNGAIAREHCVAQAGIRGAPDVDKYGNSTADEGILPALAAGDPTLDALGLELEDPEGEPSWFLLSDDGRAASLVAGRVLWKRGAPYESDRVKTWSRDYPDGEGVRLIGVSYAEVNAGAPMVRFDASPLAMSACLDGARQAVQALLDSVAWFGFYLVCDAEPGPYVPAEPAEPERKKKTPARPRAPRLAKSFAPRPLGRVLEALGALSEEPVSVQVLDDARFARAHARGDLSFSPDPPPHAALFEWREAPEPATLEDPQRLLREAVPTGAIGTWNAGGTAKHSTGDGWAVLDVELVSEQEDEAFDSRVGVLIALFALKGGGWASALWPGSRPEEVARLLGFDPWAHASWRDREVWLGE